VTAPCKFKIVVVLVAVAGAAMALGTGSAVAATVTVIPLDPTSSMVQYQADAAEVNHVVLSADAGMLVFDDPGITIGTAAPECQVSGSTARCNATGVEVVQVVLADLDDTGTVHDSAYSPPLSVIVLDGGDGSDTLTGGAGPDSIVGNAGNDDIHSGGGADDISPGVGDDTVDAGPGDDRVEPQGPGDDVLIGGEGHDELSAGDGVDVVEGGVGDDLLRGGPGDDVVRGGPGADRLDFEITGDPETRALGSDQFDGGAGDDALSAGLERDAADTFSGGDGIDTVDFSGRTAPVIVTIDGLPGDGATGEQDNVGTDIERVLAGRDSDTIVGSAGGELLDGGPGNDLLDGQGGADELIGGPGDSGSDTARGGAGADVLRGGPGDDDLNGGAENDAVFGDGGTDSLAGDDGADALSGGPGIDALQGGDGNDVLLGGAELLIGADGGDTLDAGPGDDLANGGPGDDTLDGGLGSDRLIGELGRDTVSYRGRNVPVTVTFDDLPNDGEPGENDNVARDIEVVLGGENDDNLTGDAAANVLDAGSGEDYADGRGGVDSLAGGTAADTLRARDGARDLVSCGGGRDFAVVDTRDVVRDCERVDDGTRRRPVLARDAGVVPRHGVVGLRLPAARRWVPLVDRVHVPMGTTVDAQASTVRVTSASDRRGATHVGEFSGGAFKLKQRARPGSATVLSLARGSFRVCRSGEPAAAGRVVRRLSGRVEPRWGSGGKRKKGRFRTRGRNSSSGVRGTRWLVEDRCDGTRTRVFSGRVRVRDFARRRTVIVNAGESYLARPVKTSPSRSTRPGP
jgi:Ca2+-binding RTX toxin-like protein